MPQYRRAGVLVRSAEHNFWMRQVREASYRLLLAAENLVAHPPHRFPDVRGKTVRGDAFKWIDLMNEAASQVEDQRLRGLCLSLRDRGVELLDLDSDALEIGAARVYTTAHSRKALAAFDAAWVLDQNIAGRIRELVEARGRVFKDVAARHRPVVRPVDQLRSSIEAMRQEIKGLGAASERLAEIVTRSTSSSSSTDKD